MKADERRIRLVVVGVTREAIRESETRGLILVDPSTPESRLFERWCGGAGISVEKPDQELVRALCGPLTAGSFEEPPEGGEAEIRRAVARRRALDAGLIPSSTLNRTALLLSSLPPPEPFLPLGDVPASAVLAMTGACTLPRSFRELEADPGELEAVERHLETMRRRGIAGDDDGSLAPRLRRRLEEAVAAGAWWRRCRPLVPKLGPGTWGIDLDL